MFWIDSCGECKFKRHIRRRSFNVLWSVPNCLLSDLLHIPHSPHRRHCKYLLHFSRPRIDSSVMAHDLAIRPDRRGVLISLGIGADNTADSPSAVQYPSIQHSISGRTRGCSCSSSYPSSYTAHKWWWLRLLRQYLWQIEIVSDKSRSSPISPKVGRSQIQH